ncbi:MAG: hypothetical protein PVG39_02405 [Desulfobacteraceae bacterium]|jgi:hypothetical protein
MFPEKLWAEDMDFWMECRIWYEQNDYREIINDMAKLRRENITLKDNFKRLNNIIKSMVKET